MRYFANFEEGWIATIPDCGWPPSGAKTVEITETKYKELLQEIQNENKAE